MENLTQKIEKLSKYLSDGMNSITTINFFFKEIIGATKTFSQVIQSSSNKIIKFGDNLMISGSIWNQGMKLLIKFTKELETFVSDFEIETVETLNGLIDNYEKSNTIFLKEVENICFYYGDLIAQVQQKKKSYKDCWIKNENLERTLSELKDKIYTSEYSGLIEEKEKQFKETKLKLNQSEKDYYYIVQEHNYIMDTKLPKVKESLNCLMLTDESRISNLNNMFSKCSKFYSMLIKQFSKTEENLLSLSKQNKIEESNSYEDVFTFHSLDKIQKIDFVPNFETLIRNNYIPYELFKINEWDRDDKTSDLLFDPRHSQKTLILSPNKLTAKEIDSQLLNKSIGDLLKNELVDNKEDIIEIFQSNRGIIIFCNFIKDIKSPIYLTNPNSFIILGEITNALLNGIINLREENPYLFYQVLLFSKNLYLIEKIKKPFYKLIHDHQIWKDYSKWVLSIDYIIRERINNYNLRNENYMKMQKEKEKSRPDANISTFFINPFKSMFQKISKNNEKPLNSRTGEKNIVIEVLLTFAYFLGIFKVKKEVSQQILFLIAFKNSIEISRISDIFLEFQTSQSLIISSIVPQNGKKYQKLDFKKFTNQEVNIIVLRKLIKFISNKILLRNILLLSKKTYQDIKINVFKQLYIRLQIKITLDQKTKSWLNILDINSFNVSNFSDLKTFAENSNEEMKSQYEQIKLDIDRSFLHIKELNKDSLLNILKIYAYYDKNIEYCQGMNYLVGFLYYLYKDEQTCFRILMIIMEKYRVKEIFQKNMTYIFNSFFIIDSLINHFYPELFIHFKSENVSSSYYSSSWIITLFTNLLQNSKDTIIPALLIKIWDCFLIEKWKGIYKTIIFLIGEHKDYLSNEKFDSIVNKLNDICNPEYFESEKILERFTCFYNKIKITNSMLKKIEDNFQECKSIPLFMEKKEIERAQLEVKKAKTSNFMDENKIK